MRHTISVLVENTFGAFDRVATMFSAKGFNIHSISIGVTERSDTSRMTIVTSGDKQLIDQIVKQLNRLIDTIKVSELTGQARTERELALIKVSFQKASVDEIKNINDIFRAKIVDINNKSIIVLMPFGIIEMARSGTVALKRGEQVRPKNEYENKKQGS
jgi:acetolactate synthase-1/3 small subunit